MSVETRTICVKAYRDPGGNPTCAAYFPKGKVCEFYLTQRLGCNETCLFAEPDGKYMANLKRRKDAKKTRNAAAKRYSAKSKNPPNAAGQGTAKPYPAPACSPGGPTC